ncbi:MAG: DUF2721 domain-containing protein [Archangiaceae bacterium]|nr:DUF2721 domain-containing protein [Archangiaceae bacterium]
MVPDTQLQDITRTIQLAIAPVFLLTAIGTSLSVLTQRLARVVDRARSVEEQLKHLMPVERPPKVKELRLLERRVRLVGWALSASVLAALLVCMLIGVAFVGYLFGAAIASVVAVLFIAAVTVFMLALLFFLREVFLAIAMMRFALPPEVKQEPPPAAP